LKKRDFNKIDGTENIDPFCLEKFLGEQFEPILANSIQNVEKTKKFEGKDRSYILNMITLLAIRNQYQRDNWDRVWGDDVLYQLTKIQLSIDSSITSETLDKISVNFAASINTHIERELKSFTPILHSMANRKWALIAAPDYMDFITSDYPVTLIWKNSKQYNISSPGYESLKTQVFFPRYIRHKLTFIFFEMMR
jgi:hypothetical protein